MTADDERWTGLSVEPAKLEACRTRCSRTGWWSASRVVGPLVEPEEVLALEVALAMIRRTGGS